MDDKPMWAANRVVAPTLGSAITIPETANEFTIKALFDRLLGEIRAFSQHENEILTDAWLRVKEMHRNCHGHNLSKGNIIRIFYHGHSETTQEALNAAADVIFLYKTPIKHINFLKTNPNGCHDHKNEFQYKDFQTRSKQPTPDHNNDDIPMSHEEEAKFMQTFRRIHFYNDYRDCDSNRDNWCSSRRNDYSRDNYRSNSDDKPYDVQRQLSDVLKSQQSTNAFVKETFMDLKTQLETTTKNHQASIQNLKAKFDRFADKQSARPSGSLPNNTRPNPKVIRVKQKKLNLGVRTERMIFNIDSAMKHSYSNDDTCFSIDVIDEILEEEFDALLDEGSEILHFIE
nr:reverse transcriptase domain-containing protein [Tanacetum cinerariifolium]